MPDLQIYSFEEAAKLGLDKFQLGGKGYGLVEMVKLGLPVPSGIVITTEMCRLYFSNSRTLPKGFKEKIIEKVKEMEDKTGKKLGSPTNPLLVSVRSGAPYSMPGMLDTVLNLGMTDSVAEGLSKITGNRRFAYDTYRRFLQLFGKIVLKVDGKDFENIIAEIKEKIGAKSDLDIPASSWSEIVIAFKKLIKDKSGFEVPQDPFEQLFMAVNAVFDSWYNPRAKEYRRIYKIPEELGTAVNIVEMVYGNLDSKSATGVAFTRNPSTGERTLYGEFLVQAQGEDVVAGIRTPLPIDKLREEMPTAYKQLIEVSSKLERHFKDMQDIEFTIERGRLYMLQTRTGKRTAQAAVNIAVDMVNEGLITKEDAIARVEPSQLDQLLHRQVDPNANVKPLAIGIPASPGAAAGKVVFNNDDAVSMKQNGESIILVRPETAPEDITGIAASDGVLTSRGGKTSHAAVVTRGMGKACVVGAESIKVDLKQEVFIVNSITVRKGELITIDGGTGNVYLGKVPMIDPELSPKVNTLLSWADNIRKLGIRANADTPQNAARARSFGAEGIGLARTERMFSSPDRLELAQAMILAEDKEQRMEYLKRLKPIWKEDFKGILKAMGGFPVTIRLLDAPLHEFLPKIEELMPEVAKLEALGKDKEELGRKKKLLQRVLQLSEHNPMMGHRGVRVAMSHPEIYEVQAEAIFEAGAELIAEGVTVDIEIMIPQVAEAEELAIAKEIVEEAASQVISRTGIKVPYKIGTMIETPRAALTAGEVAKYAEFFSFGTNDLTQATFAFSRDDAEGKFMPLYLSRKILQDNPFETLDPYGVARLMKIAVEEGRRTRPELKVGICGEHGGDPRSIEICHNIGMDYVSCSPYRVPVARLAAAQAAVKTRTAGSSSV
ncbi:MAG: pyruvate, phosphate dikinase [Conexivisphaerales archaeon]